MTWLRKTAAILAVLCLFLLVSTNQASAGNFPNQTSSGSIGLQGQISAPPPTKGATIAIPANGTNFTVVPIAISGLCPNTLLVKLFANNIFVGSAECENGSYAIQANLFSGQNDLVARVYDSLDQAGPDSNVVTVSFTDAQFAAFGTHITLTSQYAVKGAPPNQELDWPITLSGGNGPYAISVDWGDGGPTSLLSQQDSGTLTLTHTYKQSGTYKIIVKATDKNGGTAFLQLVGIATGSVQSVSSSSSSASSAPLVKQELIWWPFAAMTPLFFVSFWIGSRNELYSLRKTLERTRDQVK